MNPEQWAQPFELAGATPPAFPPTNPYPWYDPRFWDPRSGPPLLDPQNLGPPPLRGLDPTAWLEANFYNGIVAIGAVGVMLVGLWMIAGSPKPQVIPIPA
jgi:hypothetical protein